MEHLSSDHRGESQRIERMVREIKSSSRSPWAGAVLVAGVFAVVWAASFLQHRALKIHSRDLLKRLTKGPI